MSGQNTFSIYRRIRSDVLLHMMDISLLPTLVFQVGTNSNYLYTPEQLIVSYLDYPVGLTAWIEELFAKQRGFDVLNHKHQHTRVPQILQTDVSDS